MKPAHSNLFFESGFIKTFTFTIQLRHVKHYWLLKGDVAQFYRETPTPRIDLLSFSGGKNL